MALENGGIVPVMEMNNNHGYGDYGCGGGWWAWILIIFVLMGGGGFGWSNRGNALTQAEMQAGFNHQDEMSQIRGITYGLADSTFALNNTVQQGVGAIQRELFATQKDIMQGNYQLGTQLAENRFAQQECCCTTNRNIDAVRYENAQNTCAIVNAVKEDGEKTRAIMVANQIQDLRDKLADRDRDLQSAAFQLSQQQQNAVLIGTLRPYPQPAYITTSPYQSVAANVAGACGCAYGANVA